MAHESFEDAETAAVMNELFVNVKVDREERPDVDALYMQATLSLAGQGGWPMTVFLTPDGRPFYAGTYFPQTARGGLPAFPDLCRAIANAYRNAARGRGEPGRRGRAPAGAGRGRASASTEEPRPRRCSTTPWWGWRASSTRSRAASAGRPSSRPRWRSSSCCAACGAGRTTTTRARWSS